MIFFVAPEAETFGMADYLALYGDGLRDRIRVVTYEEFFAHSRLPIGSFIFSSLDQLTPTQIKLVIRGREALSSAAPTVALLNDPARVLQRYDLLHVAFETGHNSFRVTRASALFRHHRFPVFLRSEREHDGSLTSLLLSQRELDRELLMACLRGYRLRDLLVVEYCDTADETGIFRKYSAYIVGDRVIPRSLVQAREWITKDEGRVFNERAVREDLEYVTGNPHENWLKETFRLANIEYGRIDYGLMNGRPQLWEINLNPTIGRRRGQAASARRSAEQRMMLAPARDHFRTHFQAALERLDSPEDPSRAIELAVSKSELAIVEAEKRALARVRSHRTAVSQLVGPPVRFLRRVIAAGNGSAGSARNGSVRNGSAR